MTTRNYLGSTYEEIRDGLHTGISERTLKIVEERERIAIVVKLKGILTVNNYSEEDNNQIKNILKNMKEIL